MLEQTWVSQRQSWEIVILQRTKTSDTPVRVQLCSKSLGNTHKLRQSSVHIFLAIQCTSFKVHAASSRVNFTSRLYMRTLFFFYLGGGGKQNTIKLKPCLRRIMLHSTKGHNSQVPTSSLEKIKKICTEFPPGTSVGLLDLQQSSANPVKSTWLLTAPALNQEAPLLHYVQVLYKQGFTLDQTTYTEKCLLNL